MPRGDQRSSIQDSTGLPPDPFRSSARLSNPRPSSRTGSTGVGEGLRYKMSGYNDSDFRPPSMTQVGHSTPSTPGSNRLSLPPRVGSVDSTASAGSKAAFAGTAGAGAGAGAGATGASSLGRNMSARRHAPNDGWQEPKGFVPTDPRKRRWLFFGVPLFLLLAAGIGIGVGVGVTQSKHKSSSSTPADEAGSGDNSGSSSGGGDTQTNTTAPVQQTTLVTGGDGSTVTMDDGTSFTYNNAFGGTWAMDPANPFNVSGRAQNWTPSLTEEWTWGKDGIKGVNLGGWLLTEPFIVPSLYEAWQNSTPTPVDEYTLSQAMGNQLASAMEDHYKTFITEQDFALIAAAGLNWLRIPLGFWALETQGDEPYLAKVSWTYFNKAIVWARKYGLRILLDFHGLPGSQNPWNHSGKGGMTNWMYGVMGLANAQRSLEQMRSMTEYLSQPGIREVVPMIGLVNEVQASVIGLSNLQAFYYQAYAMIRKITGFGTGNGPIIAIHEGFMGVDPWSGFLNGADRLAIDQHPYLAFPTTQSNGSWSDHTNQACGWGQATNFSRINFGITIGGEWSLAPNDCGYWLTGVNTTPQYVQQNVGSCDPWEEWMDFSQATKDGMMQYCMGQMDALADWFFWTWKISNSTVKGYPTSPHWHYKLGWEQGWIPKDPRAAQGYCAASASAAQASQFDGTYPASATGGVATPTLNPDQLASHTAWPPTSIGPNFGAGDVALFPTLTQTGAPLTLPTPTPTGTVTPTAAPTIDGWENNSDTVGAWVTVAGCSYPPEYSANAASNLPGAVCTGR